MPNHDDNELQAPTRGEVLDEASADDPENFCTRRVPRLQRNNKEFTIQTTALLQEGNDPNLIEAEQQNYAEWMQ